MSAARFSCVGQAFQPVVFSLFRLTGEKAGPTSRARVKIFAKPNALENLRRVLVSMLLE
jgi:hypothetical protein